MKPTLVMTSVRTKFWPDAELSILKKTKNHSRRVFRLYLQVDIFSVVLYCSSNDDVVLHFSFISYHKSPYNWQYSFEQVFQFSGAYLTLLKRTHRTKMAFPCCLYGISSVVLSIIDSR
jgi:hypothetical protein